MPCTELESSGGRCLTPLPGSAPLAAAYLDMYGWASLHLRGIAAATLPTPPIHRMHACTRTHEFRAHNRGTACALYFQSRRSHHSLCYERHRPCSSVGPRAHAEAHSPCALSQQACVARRRRQINPSLLFPAQVGKMQAHAHLSVHLLSERCAPSEHPADD